MTFNEYILAVNVYLRKIDVCLINPRVMDW